MHISVEKTVKQKLSNNIVSTAERVSIVHLPHQSLDLVADAAIRLNDQAGSSKAIPHVAARIIRSQPELDSFIQTCLNNSINTVLLIGGNPTTGIVYQNAFDVAKQFAGTDIKLLCGRYPEKDTKSGIARKLLVFDGSISQLCLNPSLLKNFTNWTTVGVPSMTDAAGIWRYLKLCGAGSSAKYLLQSWRGVFYLNSKGFDTKRFVDAVGHNQYHVYNFGNLEKTLESLL